MIEIIVTGPDNPLWVDIGIGIVAVGIVLAWFANQ